jgi:dihydroflavonol-4-reductase
MGHLLALEKGVSGESYILGGENYRYTDMMRRTLRIAGEKRRIWEVPTIMLKPVAYLLLAIANKTGNAPLMTPSEVDMARKGLVLDTTKARRELGLTIRPLEQSLRDSLRWFAENGYIENARLAKKFASK